MCFSNDGPLVTSNVQPANNEETRRLTLERCMRSFTHACLCREEICEYTDCQRMKAIVQHIKTCRRRTTGGCQMCKQIVALCCYHARHCEEVECYVPFCSGIKQKLREHNATR